MAARRKQAHPKALHQDDVPEIHTGDGVHYDTVFSEPFVMNQASTEEAISPGEGSDAETVRSVPTERSSTPIINVGGVACELCSARFSGATALDKHKQMQHNESLPFECSQCFRRFKHRKSRNRHMLAHSETRKYVCQLCEAAFYRSDHLKAHVNGHFVKSARAASRSSHGSVAAKRRTVGCECSDRDSNHSGNSGCEKCQHKKQRLDSASPPLDSSVYSASPAPTPIKLEPHSPEGQCVGCGALFDSTEDVTRHTCPFQRNHSCPFCHGTFHNSDMFRKHLREQNCSLHGGADESSPSPDMNHLPSSSLSPPAGQHGGLICPLCHEANFNQSAELVFHLSMVHAFRVSPPSVESQSEATTPANEPITCECQTRVAPSDLMSHMASKHALVAFKCGLCGELEPDMEKLCSHFEAAHTPAKCPQCSSTLRSRLSLAEHISATHTLRNCPCCALELTQRDLDLHLVAVHGFASMLTGLNGKSQLSEGDAAHDQSSASFYDNVFQCMACSRTFRSRDSLRQHFHSFHELRDGSFTFVSQCYYVCSRCVEVFPTRERQISHDLLCHSDNLTSLASSNSIPKIEQTTHVCRFCNVCFDVAIALEQHVVTKHSAELLQSTNSAVPTGRPDAPATITAAAGPECRECHVTFESQFQLDSHVLSAHTNMAAIGGESATLSRRLPMQCVICDEQCSSAESLAEHKLARHPTHRGVTQRQPRVSVNENSLSPDTICTRCNANFNTAANLQTHIAKFHLNQLPAYDQNNMYNPLTARCRICNTDCPDAPALQLHLLAQHTSNVSFCPVCGQNFNQLTLLTTHLLVHREDEKRIHCEICNKNFHFNIEFQNHQFEHHDPPRRRQHDTNEQQDKVCVAPGCNATFVNARSLANHMRSHRRGSEWSKNSPASRPLTSENEYRT